MNEQNYEAWDGKTYPWPPPSGWYLAHDQKWWPEGYGPKDGDDKKAAATPPAEVTPTPVATETQEAPAAAAQAPAVETQQAAPKTQTTTTVAEQPSQTTTNNISYASDNGLSGTEEASGMAKWLGIGVGVLALAVIGLLLMRVLGGGGSNSADDAYAVAESAVGIYTPEDPDNAVWAIDVTSGSTVIAADQLGSLPAPAAGDVYLRSDVTVQNLGGATDLSGLTLKGVSGGEIFQLDEGCMAQAGSLTAAFTGQASASGYVCWEVSSEVAEDLVLSAELSTADGEVFFDIN